MARQCANQDFTWGDVSFNDSLASISFSCWLRIDDWTSSSGSGVLVREGETAGNGTLTPVQRDFSSDFLRSNIWTTDDGLVSDADGAPDLNEGQWYQRVVTWTDGEPMRTYMDGSLQSSSATLTGVTRTTTDTLVCGRTDGDGSPLYGTLAEMAYWDAQLSAAEAAALAAGAWVGNVRPGNLTFYAPLVRDLNDRVGGLTATNDGSTVATHPRIWYPRRKIVPVGISALPFAGGGMVGDMGGPSPGWPRDRMVAG